MKRPWRILLSILLASGTATLGGSPALFAQAITPGEEGALATFVPPEPGKRACFSRVYDAAHLKKHPKQMVTEMHFRIAYYRHDPDKYAPEGQRNYYFELDAKLRGSDRKLSAGGECGVNGTDGSISCGVECDGGGVIVKRLSKPGEILVDLEAFGRLRMTLSCDESEENAVELEPGEDDKSFLLRETSANTCPAYDDW